MQFRESLHLIADSHKLDDYAQSIGFMKSFGLKCDSVGWTTIVLDNAEQFDLVKEMCARASEQKLSLRCFGYRKDFYGTDAEWFYISPAAEVKGNDCEWDEHDYDTCVIKGYKLPKGAGVVNVAGLTAVSQSFVDTCRDLQLTGTDFMWVTDKGRYDAPPYFYILPEKTFQRYTEGYGDLFYKPKSRMHPKYKSFILNCRQVDSDGSHMEEMANLFNRFEMPELPEMLDQMSEPDTDFAFLGAAVLIRKSAAEKLISKKLLKWSELRPAVYFDEKKHSRLVRTCKRKIYMPERIKEEQVKRFEVWKTKKRPPFNPKEKDALSLLRRAKAECPAYYNDPLKKATLSTLSDTAFVPLLPYYKISNGCAINDEIDILSYEDIGEENTAFFEDLQAEELILEEISGLRDAVVFGIAANGDKILLMPDGSVMRYDHEDPHFSEIWKNMHTFFYEQIEIVD